MITEKERVKNTFDKSADKFDEIGPPMFKYFGEILADFTDILPTDQVLDIGCGKGASTFPIAKNLDKTGKITGIDISPLMIKKCKSLVPENLNEQIKLKVMDTEQLEFTDNSFDKVVSSFGLFFLSDIKKGLDEIRRVLKPGGLLVFSTWNNEYQLPWLKEILAKYIPKLNIIKNSIANGINESDFRTLHGIEKILKTCTLNKKEIKTENMDC